MERPPLLLLLLCFGLVAVPKLRAGDDDPVAAGASGAEAVKPVDQVRFATDVIPFFEDYCTACHGKRHPKAKIDLSAFRDASSVATGRKVFEKVLKMLRKREMPPEDEDQPSESRRQTISDWIAAELDKFDCSGEVDPGRVTIRRLNRTEYDNTVRDLFGVDLKPAENFPADDVGYGFDNIGDVLAVSPLLAEKYFEAADRVVEEALKAEREFYFYRRFEAESQVPTAESTVYRNRALSINREGEVGVDVEFPEDGEYILRARVWGEQAGPELTRMGIRLDGKQLREIEVAATIDDPRTYELRVKTSKGKKRYAIAYLNNYVNFNHPDPALRGDRNFLVDWFEVEKLADARVDGPRRIFSRHPGSIQEQEACLRTILEGFVKRAHRRPVDGRQLERLVALALRAIDDGDSFEQAVALAMKAVLVSPYFLFRIEDDPPTPESANEDGVFTYDLENFALASRLSYFLWSSMPDDELFALAEAGRLVDPDVLEAQARRMLDDPKSAAFVENFASQWLQTRGLADMSPDPGRFPSFDEALRRDMEKETLLFFESLVRDDRSILELIDSDYTFLNERLAKHYGIEGVEGENFRRVRVADTPRGGVLTQASILTLTSDPTRTSPVKRGKWILERILGTPPPPPPPNVVQLSEEPEAILSGSLRQRMEKHRKNPTCAVCHEKMDSLGFAFENFDAIGAWREFDGNFLVDPSGILPDGRKFDGVDGLKSILKSQKDLFARNLTEKILTYALGRGLEYYDKCAVDRIVESLRGNGYRFSSLLVGVVRSEPFRRRRGSVTSP